MSDASAPGLSYQEIRNAADLLARQAVASGRLTEEQCAARRPGAPGHEEDSASTWLIYFGWLSRQLGEAPAQSESAARSVDGVLTAALLDESEPVILASGQAVRVYPKSFHALCLMEGLDGEFRALRTELLSWIDDADPLEEAVQVQRLELLDAALRSKWMRVWAWIVTHEGPGLPFDEAKAGDMEPPEWTLRLTLDDLVQLLTRHAQVNRDDVGLLAHAFPSDNPKTPSRLPLSGFLGAMAQEWGVRAAVVMRDWTLRGTIAQSLAAAQSAREARQAADRART